MVSLLKSFRSRTLMLMFITGCLMMVMHINFSASLNSPSSFDNGHSSPIVWETPIETTTSLDKTRSPCDRGVECDLYSQDYFEASNIIPEIEHEFPQPPFTPPLSTLKRYKGLYRCDVNTGCPTYSAAFLTTRDQILSRHIGPTELGNKLTNMESASYHLFGKPGTSAVWTSVDAFDFSVEHISMYERVLKSTDMQSSPLKDAVLSAYSQRLTLLERDQRHRCSEGPGAVQWHALRSADSESLGKRTVAVMPFYAVGAGSGHSIRDTKEESGLPIHDVIMLTDLPRPSSTGMYTVKQIQERLQSSPKWRDFEFVFYTEADQILHLRTTQVFAPLENPTNEANRHPNPKIQSLLRPILVPHRFHSVPSSSDFKHIESHFNNSKVFNMLVQSPTPERVLSQWAKKKEADPNAFLWYHPSETKTTIRREMELYESRPLTRFDAVGEDDSCCFLHARDMAAQNHPSFITPKYYPSSDANLRPQVSQTDVLAIGNGFAMVAGDCCFICTFKNRYCHNNCQPRRGDDSDCGMGSFGSKVLD